MKKVFTLLGILAIVAACLCTFDVSAKEKTSIKCEIVVSNVSCETLAIVTDVVIYRAYLRAPAEKSKDNDLATIPNDTTFLAVVPYIDRYRQRSQAWIRWNNIYSIGKSTKVKNVSTTETALSTLRC